MIARQQFRRAAGILVALGIPPAFFFVVGGLIRVERRNIVEHEAAPFLVPQHASLASNPFRDQNAADAGRPDHSRRMELHEFHVHQCRARVVGERVAVAGVFPTVAGDFVGPADAARRQHHGFGAEQVKSSALAVIPKCADHAVAILQQRHDRVFHEDVDAEMNPVVLQRADHLQAGAVAHVRQPRVAMAAEVALQNAAVAACDRTARPSFEFAHACRRFLGVQFGHPPVVQVLAAAHGVGKVNAPAVAIVDIGQRGGDAAFGHHGMRLAQQRFRDHRDFHACGRGFDGGAQAGASRANHQHVVLVRDVLGH